MNTKVNYLYRDANNYKIWNQCIVKGVLSDEQKEGILNSLHEGEFFIPRKVGIPERRFDKWDTSDHVWFEIERDAFIETEEEPTINISADELTKYFYSNKGKWEEDLGLSIEEARRSVDMHQWTVTDPDCLQIRRLTDYENPKIFELVQVDIYDTYDKTKYMIAHGDIDLTEFTEKEIDDFLKMYGYSTMEELINLVGSEIEAKAQVAEMIFETYNTEYHVEQHNNWNEVVSRIEEYTELDLSEYKKELQMEDFDYLSSFYYKEDEFSAEEEKFILGMITSNGTAFYISEKYGDLIRGTNIVVDSAINIEGKPDYYVLGGYAENGLFFIYDEEGNIGKDELELICDKNPVYISEKMNEIIKQHVRKEDIENRSLNVKIKTAGDRRNIFDIKIDAKENNKREMDMG